MAEPRGASRNGAGVSAALLALLLLGAVPAAGASLGYLSDDRFVRNFEEVCDFFEQGPGDCAATSSERLEPAVAFAGFDARVEGYERFASQDSTLQATRIDASGAVGDDLNGRPPAPYQLGNQDTRSFFGVGFELVAPARLQGSGSLFVTGATAETGRASFRLLDGSGAVLLGRSLSAELAGDAETDFVVDLLLGPGSYRLAASASALFAGTAGFDVGLEAVPVPEPGSFAAVAWGLASVAWHRRRCAAVAARGALA